MNKNFGLNLSKTVNMHSKTLPHFRKTDAILYLPYLKPVREKMRKLHLFDTGYKSRHSEGVSPKNLFNRNRSFAYAQDDEIAAFTLAETLITLTILGVVAAITVPSLINRQIEAANRTKVKKAMAVYEKALNQMIIDNDIKGDIGTALNDDNCSKTTEYFKKVETTASDCRFKTADRIWWDISDIEHPVISLKDKITTEAESAAIKAKADSIEKDKTSFVMVGEIKDSIVRINDKGVTTATPDKNYLDKLYGFMNNDVSTGGNTVDPNRPCSNDTKDDNGGYVSCTDIQNDGYGVAKIDENGVAYYYAYGCTNGENCGTVSIDLEPNVLTDVCIGWECEDNGYTVSVGYGEGPRFVKVSDACCAERTNTIYECRNFDKSSCQ